jgi:hypothetical protein
MLKLLIGGFLRAKNEFFCETSFSEISRKLFLLSPFNERVETPPVLFLDRWQYLS